MSGNDTAAIHPNLRAGVFRIAVTAGGRAEYEAVKHEYCTTTSIDGKEIALQSLGRVHTEELALDFISFIFSPAVAVQDVHSGATSLANNPKPRQILWDFIKNNWETIIYPRLSGNMVVLDRFLRLSLNRFSSVEVADDIAAFFASKDNRGYDRSLGVISDTIRGFAKYRARDALVVKEWLEAHGYV
jgi:aminopeptidase N